MNRYESNQKGISPALSAIQNEFSKMPRGVFDLSRRKIFDATPFAITPLECWEMLPNSDVDIAYDLQMITKNPTIKRIMSSMQAEIRVYRCDYNDLWEGWNNFITKGRTGKVAKSIPYVDFSLGTDTKTTSLPYNPAHLLSITPSVFLAKDANSAKFAFEPNSGVQNVDDLQNSALTGIDTLAKLKSANACKVSALPFVLYEKICKEYLNPNLMQDNPHWFPENENHELILPYDVDGAVTTADYDNPKKEFDDDSIALADNDSNSYPWLNVIQYAPRKGDYFNTGSPFPDLIRGDVPTLDVLNASVSADIDFSDLFITDSTRHGNVALLGFSKQAGRFGVVDSSTVSAGTFGSLGYEAGIGHDELKLNTTLYAPSAISNSTLTSIKNLLKSGVKVTNSIVDGIQFSMNQWRQLATLTVFKERMARTDGSYNQMIEAQFRHNPKWHIHSPTYCGGHRQSLVFNEVVQTSEDNNSPLGTTAGRAVSASQSKTIHVHSDDFGCFMAVMVLHPDEYYSQGSDKMWTRLENAEQYFPIMNNLAPDATLNKELFITGDNDVDDDVFNYQERFAYYKSRRNQVSGLMALPISKIGDTGAYLFNRLFDGSPNFNVEFNRGILTDNEKNVFASTNQAQFTCVLASRMRFVAPVPEKTQPADMGISY